MIEILVLVIGFGIVLPQTTTGGGMTATEIATLATAVAGVILAVGGIITARGNAAVAAKKADFDGLALAITTLQAANISLLKRVADLEADLDDERLSRQAERKTSSETIEALRDRIRELEKPIRPRRGVA